MKEEMTENYSRYKHSGAKIIRKATLLFEYMRRKQQNDKKIGELTIQDFFEVCAFLADIETKIIANEEAINSKNKESLNA